MSSPTLFAALQRAAELRNESLGYRYLDRKERPTWQSFEAVADRSARIANGLLEKGVQTGDTVAIVLPTGPDFVDAFFACSHIGAIPVPLYPPVRLGRLDEYYEKTADMLSVSKAALLLTDSRAGKLLGQVLRLTAPPLGMCRVDDVCHDTPATPRPPTADDIAMVQSSEPLENQSQWPSSTDM